MPRKLKCVSLRMNTKNIFGEMGPPQHTVMDSEEGSSSGQKSIEGSSSKLNSLLKKNLK